MSRRRFCLAAAAAVLAAAVLLPGAAFATLPAPTVTSPGNMALVGASFAVTGASATSAIEARVTIDGSVFVAAVDPATGAFSVPSAAPYGRSKVLVEVRDPEGWSAPTSLVVYQLGSVPAYPRYVLIDKSDFMLYLVRGGVVRAAYPIAIGMPGAPTRTGTFRLGRPVRSPSAVWGALRMPLLRAVRVRVKVRVRYRRRWVRRWAWRTVFRNSTYYVHGTNDPSSIGTMASHGCVRMYNRDVIALSRQTGVEPAVIRN